MNKVRAMQGPRRAEPLLPMDQTRNHASDTSAQDVQTDDTETISYFKTVPWCAKIINDPRYVAGRTITRLPKSSGEDSLMAETLKTDRTIKRWLTIHSKADGSLELPIQEVLMFFEVGNGLNGYPGVCHGGFIATMLDEVTGYVQNMNLEYQRDHGTGKNSLTTHMTAYLNTRYLAPVPTPGIILATGKIAKVQGRKQWLTGSLKDSTGKVMATTECLYIEARKDPRANAKL